jgi:outer membrane receptor for Fe3+-dicitrate
MKKKFTHIQICSIIFYFFFVELTLSQTQTELLEKQKSSAEIDSSFIKMNDFPQVDVIGRKPALINRIPGSANIITEASLKNDKPFSGNEMFKKVTGLNVVDEEGVWTQSKCWNKRT